MDENKEVIMCVPFGAPEYIPGNGYKLTPCGHCKNSMWIGPKQDKKRSEGMDALCFKCIVALHGPEAVLKGLQHLGG